jgi:choline dehydrogenase-like flavoprotein
MTTDALVIGSGFGAAATALRLVESGVRVIMAERGPRIDPHKDFRQTQDPRYFMKYYRGAGGPAASMTWIEAYGGASGFYEMVALRAPSRAFTLLDVDEEPLWPEGITRHTLDPYYALAEHMQEIEQISPDDVPKSGIVFAMMMKRLGISVERIPFAVQGCIGSGCCLSGCIYGNKRSMLVNYLPAAEEHGMEVLTDMTVLRLIANHTREDRTSTLEPRYTALCRSSEGEQIRIDANIVVLGAGTVGTAGILMRSRDELRNLSRHVGHHIAMNGSIKMLGMIADDLPDGDNYTGRSHPGLITYDFLDTHDLTLAAGKTMPMLAATFGHFTIEGRAQPHEYWGEQHADFMRRFRHRALPLYTIGLTPPTTSLKGTSPTGMVPSTDLTNEVRTHFQRAEALMHDIYRRSNFEIVRIASIDMSGSEISGMETHSTHMMGSARMATSRDRGVCDQWGEVFGHPGLHVVDGAAIPSSLAVNPSLTILANAERIAHELQRRYGSVRTPEVNERLLALREHAAVAEPPQDQGGGE